MCGQCDCFRRYDYGDHDDIAFNTNEQQRWKDRGQTLEEHCSTFIGFMSGSQE